MSETAQEIAEQTLPEPIVTVSDAGPALKKVSLEIPAELIAAKLGENYQSLQDEAAIPGFRRGHAPQRLLEKRFGKDIRLDVYNQLVSQAYQHAVEKYELRVLGSPELLGDDRDADLPESGSIKLEVEIEVVPEFKLPELKGLEVSKPLLEVTDEQVEAEVKRYGEMYGQQKAVDQAEGDDYITGDVRVLSESGEELQEQKGAQMVVPGDRRKFKGAIAGIIVQDLGNQLKGKKAGERVTITATGPKHHEVERIAGKPITIELDVSRVERLQPMSAEELVANFGLENEQALKDQTKQTLEQRNTAEQRRAMADQVVEAIMKQVDFDLPEKISSRQASSFLQRKAMDLMQQGVGAEEIEQRLAELRSSSEGQARQALKHVFVMDEVARTLDVEVTEAEVNGRIYQMATYQGLRPERLRDQMRRNGQLDNLFVRIREEKAINKLIAEAKVTEVSADEWAKLNGGDEAKPAKKPRAKKAD